MATPADNVAPGDRSHRMLSMMYGFGNDALHFRLIPPSPAWDEYDQGPRVATIGPREGHIPASQGQIQEAAMLLRSALGGARVPHIIKTILDMAAYHRCYELHILPPVVEPGTPAMRVDLPPHLGPPTRVDWTQLPMPSDFPLDIVRDAPGSMRRLSRWTLDEWDYIADAVADGHRPPRVPDEARAGGPADLGTLLLAVACFYVAFWAPEGSLWAYVEDGIDFDTMEVVEPAPSVA